LAGHLSVRSFIATDPPKDTPKPKRRFSPCLFNLDSACLPLDLLGLPFYDLLISLVMFLTTWFSDLEARLARPCLKIAPRYLLSSAARRISSGREFYLSLGNSLCCVSSWQATSFPSDRLLFSPVASGSYEWRFLSSCVSGRGTYASTVLKLIVSPLDPFPSHAASL